MSCNGCRVLRKGCSETCILRPCLQWIESAESQGHATVFVAKFFGRAGLMSFISAVPELQRPALFQSLLFEACGRTVNPVNGAVGMFWTGNWHVCQAAVETVLRGGTLRPISDLLESPSLMISSDESSVIFHRDVSRNENQHRRFSTSGSMTEMKDSPVDRKRMKSDSDLDLQVNHQGLTLTASAVPVPFIPPPLFCKVVNGDRPGSPSEESVTTSCWEKGMMRGGDNKYKRNKGDKKLLNLFV
ncbi:PREDICTED: LOB domain-containing protein 39 isoform X3 [Camelina sativa]|uniref:LOB domain-containing protein 39 isoform X3 n=1 Tax=Camelina sativa TaxID=90675 RepID=A0ABM0U7R1_CAMSA|nr:PREDICTED: LOB domain-containing protein 39 isoform X3 [Camelina sativa]